MRHHQQQDQTGHPIEQLQGPHTHIGWNGKPPVASLFLTDGIFSSVLRQIHDAKSLNCSFGVLHKLAIPMIFKGRS